MEDKNIFEYLITNGIIFDGVKETTSDIIKVCSLIFMLLYTLYIGYMYFKHHTFSLETQKLGENLIKGLLIYVGLIFYIPLADMVVSLASLIFSSFALSPEELNMYFESFSVKDNESAIKAWIRKNIDYTNATAALAVQLARFVVLLSGLVMMNMLYCFGPFAIMFSLVFPDKFQFWFTTFLNVLFVPLTINVIDRIMWSIIRRSNELIDGGSMAENYIVEKAVMMCGVICYCLAYWLTSTYIGNKNAGMVLSIASTYGKQMMIKAISGIGKGLGKLLKNLGSGKGGGSGGATDIAGKAGKDHISNEN